MRNILSCVSLVALGAIAFQAGAGCSSSSDAPADESCQFAQDEDNCWRQLTRSIDDCLTDEPEGDAATLIPPPPADKGTLSADATSCSYGTGRGVTFAKDPRVQATGSGTSMTQPDRDFIVTMNGKTCLHYSSSNNMQNVTVSGPGGTFTVDSTAYTCPDGSRLTVNPMTLLEKCAGAVVSFGPPPNLPGLYGGSGFSPSTGEVALHLLGMGKEAYDCTPSGSPSGDAGTD